MNEVLIYTKNSCLHCFTAKELLKKKGIEYQEIDITNSTEKIDDLSNKTGGMRTVPQIFVNGTHLGGYNELLNYCNNFEHNKEKSVIKKENNDISHHVQIQSSSDHNPTWTLKKKLKPNLRKGRKRDPLKPDQKISFKTIDYDQIWSKGQIFRLEYRIILNFLIRKFPLVFGWKNVVVLKVGILNDILEHDIGISRNKLNNFLQAYCNKRLYRELHVEGTARYDLNGNEAGVVTKEHVEGKQANLEKARQIREEKMKKSTEESKSKDLIDEKNWKRIKKKKNKTKGSIVEIKQKDFIDI